MLLEKINTYVESINQNRIRRGLPESDVKKIVNSYDKYGGSAAKAAKSLPYHHLTILSYWKKAGLKIRKGREGGDLSAPEIRKIIKAHKKYNGNASEAARNLLYNPRTISKYWKKKWVEALWADF